MSKIKTLLKGLTGFLDNTGMAWFGYLGGAIFVFLFTPKTWFWGVVFGVLIGMFIFKNIVKIKEWANDKIDKIKDRVENSTVNPDPKDPPPPPNN